MPSRTIAPTYRDRDVHVHHVFGGMTGMAGRGDEQARGDYQGHGGILFRGADGRLFFLLDSWSEAKPVVGAPAQEINRYLGFDLDRDRDQDVDQQLTFPLRQEVIDELVKAFQGKDEDEDEPFILWPFGILFFRAARLRR